MAEGAMDQEQGESRIDLPVVNAGVLLTILTVLLLTLPDHLTQRTEGPRGLWQYLGAWSIDLLRGDRSPWRLSLIWFVVAIVLGLSLRRLSALSLAFIPPLIATIPFTREMYGDFGPGDIIHRSGFLIPLVEAILLSPVFFVGALGIGIGIWLSELPERLEERRLAR